jgi:probable phosphoglycerate mutase
MVALAAAGETPAAGLIAALRHDLYVKSEIWLVRHGPTEWSGAGRHTSRTDATLTDAGRAAAAALAPFLADHDFALVLASPASRALETARLAGFGDCEVAPDLHEWSYGDMEGLTTAEIRERGPEWADWTVWSGPLVNGETVDDVAARARRIVARAEASSGDVLLFGHGHQLRILAAVALELGPSAGARLALDAATVSVLGHEHERRVLRLWNFRPGIASAPRRRA